MTQFVVLLKGCSGWFNFCWKRKQLLILTNIIMIDYYKKMSQNQIFSVDNKLSDNWKPHPFESDIFINVVSNEQVQRFYLQLSKGHDVYFQKRMQENHPSIVKVRYFHVLENKSHSEDKIVYVYVDRMLPVNRSNWIPINTALSVLKGFRRLSSIHGFMRVNQKMISMNEKGQLKIWINENPIINQVTVRAISQEQMLADIIRIIMNYDSETGGLLGGCKTINQAINNILVSLAQPKSAHQFSQRTKQDKIGRLTDKVQDKNNCIYQSDRFKSKKADELWKNSSDPKKVVNFENSKVQQNYLQNVHIAKMPKYLNTHEQVPEKVQNERKTFVKTSQQPHLGINKKNSIQFNNSNPIPNKVSSQNKNPPYEVSNEASWQSQDRFIKPARIHGMVNGMVSPTIQISSPQNNQNYPFQTYINNRFQENKTLWKNAKKVEQQQLNQRKSDLHEEFALRQGEKGRNSQFPHFIQNRKKNDSTKRVYDEKLKRQNEKKELVTSSNVENKDMGRTRTQDFTNFIPSFGNAEQQWGNYTKSPNSHSYNNFIKGESNLNINMKRDKLKDENKITNRKQLKSSENESQKDKMVESKTDYLLNKKYTSGNSYYSSVQNEIFDSGKIKIQKEISPKKVGQESELKIQKVERIERVERIEIVEKIEKVKDNGSIASSQNSKKNSRQELAKQLKLQFNCLLTPTQIKQKNERENHQNTDEKPLLNAKSSKDMLIKQKVEKKRATFAQLKSEAIKILNDPLF